MKVCKKESLIEENGKGGKTSIRSESQNRNGPLENNLDESSIFIFDDFDF